MYDVDNILLSNHIILYGTNYILANIPQYVKQILTMRF